MSAVLKTRLAPTPSGLLHPGNGLSFVMTWALARAAGARILLRIDDLDDARRRDEYLEDIFVSLDWLGLDYDEGPTGPQDFLQHWSQHQRLDLYEEALQQLAQTTYCYACVCSRKQLAAQAGANGLYPGSCRAAGLPLDTDQCAWRVRVPEQSRMLCQGWRSASTQLDVATLMGDFVVRQKNGFPAYQLASLVDDRHFGVNAIVRGEDLWPSTAAQLFLAQCLEWPEFSAVQFWHHGLLVNEQGEKLSKSKGAGALRAWREAGKSPEELYQLAATWLGLPPEAIPSVRCAADLVAGLPSGT